MHTDFSSLLSSRHVDVAYGSAAYWHLIIEALRLSFADTQWYVADPDKSNCPVEQLLSDKYAQERSSLIDFQRYCAHCYWSRSMMICPG